MDTPFADMTTRAPAVLIKAVQLPHLKHLYLVRFLLVFLQTQLHHCQILSVLHSRFGLDVDIVLFFILSVDIVDIVIIAAFATLAVLYPY